MQTFAHLPLGWSILYPLARLELDTLEALVREGVVHPELTVKQAEALARSKGKRRGSKPKRHPVKARLGKFAKFVTATLPEWSSHQTELASAGLREILQQIEFTLPSHHGR
jgi:hypothetical protein